MASHRTLSGASLHIPGYIQSSDPGAVGAGILWAETDEAGGTAKLWVRNQSDDGWLEVVLQTVNTPATGNGSPEGAVTATPGVTYWDALNQSLWVKDTGTGNTGWKQLIA